PYNPAMIKRKGYKGDNTRGGFVEIEEFMVVTNIYTGSEIQIFPNPSEVILTFKIPHAVQNAKVQIFSIDGKIVFSEEGNLETTNSYNLKHLNSGLYFVTISDGKKTFTAKWVKN